MFTSRSSKLFQHQLAKRTWITNIPSTQPYTNLYKPSRIVLFQWGNALALPRNCYMPNNENILSPREVKIDDRETLETIAAGWGHSLIATKDIVTGISKIYAFGLNGSGQLGIGGLSKSPTNGIVKRIPKDGRVQQLACGREHSHILIEFEEGHRELFSFGNSMYGQLGLNNSKHDFGESSSESGLVCEDLPKKVEGYEGNVKMITCGLDHTIFLTDQNRLYSMGWGADGQLGLGLSSSSDRATPGLIKRLVGRPKVEKIVSSTDFTLALLENGELWIWGNSEYGQSMLGWKTDRILEPVQVPIEYSITDIAAGGSFSLFLDGHGHVYTCGYGALGLGESMLETFTPQRIDRLPPIIKIFAATDYAAAIDKHGQLYTWGLNGLSGRLGNGSTNHSYYPHKVMFENNKVQVKTVDLGMYHAFALCGLG